MTFPAADCRASGPASRGWRLPVSVEAGPEIVVIARYLAITGEGGKVAALLSRHVAASQAEPGCHEFTALRGTENPDSFVLYERYESSGAFDAHVASPHYEGIARDQIRPLLRERTVELCQVITPALDEAT